MSLIIYLLKNTNEHTEVKIDSQHADWNMGKSNETNLGHKVRNHGGYHLDSPADASYSFRTKVVLEAEEINIPIKYHHGENGGPGQVEIEVEFASIVEMGDRSMKLKYLLKKYRLSATKSCYIPTQTFFK